MDKKTLIFGSRGSKLALAQSRQMLAAVDKANPQVRCELKVIKTQGDRVLDTPLTLMPGKGVFVKEIENTLLNGEIDVAVHSLKDLPTEDTPGLCIAAMPQRVDARDVLYSNKIKSLDQISDAMVIGTSSARRAAQLRTQFPQCIIKDIRGNVDTRMRKVDEGEYDATILAAAGLKRLDLQDKITCYWPTEIMLPAPAQGVLGIQTRANDAVTIEMIQKLNDFATFAAATAERMVLNKLGGGCAVPVAVFGNVENEELHLHGRVISIDDGHFVEAQSKQPLAAYEKAADEVTAQLLAAGADKILSTILVHG